MRKKSATFKVIFGLFIFLFWSIDLSFAWTVTYDTTSSLTIPGAQNPYSMNFNVTVPNDAVSAMLEIKWLTVGDNDNRDYFKCGSTVLYTTGNSPGTIMPPYPKTVTSNVTSCVRNYNLSSGNRICTANAWNTNCGGYFYGLAGGHSTMEYARLTVDYAGDPPVTNYTLAYSAGAGGTITGSTTQVVVSGEDGTAVTAVPADGFAFLDWSDDVTDNPRTDTNVDDDLSVTANFIDNRAPVISDLATSTASTSVVITWDTDEDSETGIAYGPYELYGDTFSSTTLTQSHSVTLHDLVPCSKYYYQVTATDESNNVATSTSDTFITTGCSAEAGILQTNLENIDNSSGGSLTNNRLSLAVPASFSDNFDSAVFQVKRLETTFFDVITGPEGLSHVGNDIYNLKALVDATTTLSSFSNSIQITLTYEDSDVDSLDEDSLWIYRYDDGVWHALTGCVVDQEDNSVTCETTNFSDFSLFGEEEDQNSVEDDSTSHSSGTTVEGRIKKLINMGKLKEALELQEQYSQVVVINVSSTTTNNPPAAYNFIFTQILRPKMIHNDVKELQKFLNKNGYILTLSGPGSPGQETEYFGTLTQLALVKFQEANFDTILKPLNLTKGTGIFGEATLAFVNSLLKQ